MAQVALPILQPGDTVELIAPAARCSDQLLDEIKSLLTSWQLKCVVADDIFGADLLCAHNDEQRFSLLKKALYNPVAKALICVRGGYGSMRLIPRLAELNPPDSFKLLVGMSDITALQLFLQQCWQWPTLHGALALDKFSAESIAALKTVLFGEKSEFIFSGVPLNAAAKKNHQIDTKIIGGNLTLVQTSIGTAWQMQGADKIIFLEEVNERGYRVDRMLEHLQQAKMFQGARAIILGDFTKGEEANGSSLVEPVLVRFAEQLAIPVVKIPGIGHAPTSIPLPLGVPVVLQLGERVILKITH